MTNIAGSGGCAVALLSISSTLQPQRRRPSPRPVGAMAASVWNTSTVSLSTARGLDGPHAGGQRRTEVIGISPPSSPWTPDADHCARRR